MVQRERNRLQRLFTLRRFQVAFPHRDAMPAHRCQLLLFLLVTLLVPANLRYPELAIRLRNLATLRIGKYVFTPVALWRGVGGEALMSMPEAPIHKNACPVLPQYQVRMSRQPLVVKPVPESPFPQSTPHNHLRLRVLRPNCRHIG